MTLFYRGLCLAMGLAASLAAVAASGPAAAQENLYQGKSPQQIFASDCAMCHKSPQGLAKGGLFGGTQNFLRSHYTASRETAAAMARYLEAAGEAPAEPARRNRRAAPSGESKPAARPATAKPDTKPGEAKPDAKPAEVKPEVKPETPPEAKPAEPKPQPAAETKPESKPEPKPAEPKPAEPKPADKSE